MSDTHIPADAICAFDGCGHLFSRHSKCTSGKSYCRDCADAWKRGHESVFLLGPHRFAPVVLCGDARAISAFASVGAWPQHACAKNSGSRTRQSLARCIAGITRAPCTSSEPERYQLHNLLIAHSARKQLIIVACEKERIEMNPWICPRCNLMNGPTTSPVPEPIWDPSKSPCYVGDTIPPLFTVTCD